ncbi:MAG: polysaccharide deacetylase family protein [Clostridiales bacterium]|nr:polysaccharide deacetylase family protein [Clostridiales bacterium]
MKKLILILAFVIILSSFVYAAEMDIILDGKLSSLSGDVVLYKTEDGDIPMVPLERFAGLLGAKLRYVHSEQMAIVQLGEKTIKLRRSNLHVACGGRAWMLPAKPVIKDRQLYVPIISLGEMMCARTMYDRENSKLYLSTAPTGLPKDRKISVPILMYHAVNEKPWGLKELFMRPSDMEAQIKYLAENGFNTVTFEDLPNIDKIEKPVMLTFDDGYEDNYTDLFPILKKYNAKATIFVITDSVGGKNMLTAEQIKEMSDSGLVSIQSHTSTHPSMVSLKETALLRELNDSKMNLARLTGKIPFVLAYPNGEFNQAVTVAMEEYYEYGLKKQGGIYVTDDKPYEINRIRVSRSTTLSTFKSLVKSAGNIN